MMVPQKLKAGDEIRVVAPSRSLALIPDEQVRTAVQRLEELGFKVTFSRNCRESDMFASSSVAARVEDLHAAFADRGVRAIMTVIGGFNCNQLLQFLDYELIRANPKILCGYSDITALTNAITAKTGLVTYSGPHFSSFGMKKEFEYGLEYFRRCLMRDEPFAVEPSPIWSDDLWYLDQENRRLEKNAGYLILHEGEAEGRIVGGNLCTLNLLQGTEFMPELAGSILFIEDDDFGGKLSDAEFDRNLQSLIHQPGFASVRGLVIGRFQRNSEISKEKLEFIINAKQELARIPAVAGVDFGHTDPRITFPIGGTVRLSARGTEVNLEIIEH